MKRIILMILTLAVLVAGISAWIVFSSATAFESAKKTLFIRSKSATRKAVLDSLVNNKIISNRWAFNFLSDKMNYWKNIRPGKYDIKNGTSLINLLRMLKNGRQTPVKLTIIKLRIEEDLCRLCKNKFEFDSADMFHFLNNKDSIKKFHVDSNIILWPVIPDSYTYFWTSTPTQVYEKLAEASDRFWTPERKRKALQLGLTPLQSYVLASLVEEETNNQAEKGNIASVYLNRIKKGLPLQADPTIKFALRDFRLKRIYDKYLFVESPYNTYRNKGLPPGPICTPSKNTIDAVLNAPHTDYIYFVANSNFNGTHLFSSDYREHLDKAHLYQQALNHLDSLKNPNLR